MTSSNGNLDTHLDAYLDGTLDDAARRTFERHLETRPGLQQRIADQRLIDGSIRRVFAPPPADRFAGLLERAVVASEQPTTTGTPARPLRSLTSMSWRRSAAVAAALALLIGGGWMIWAVARPAPTGAYEQQAYRSMATVYDDVVQSGLAPDVVCRDDEEFASWFRRSFGQPLRLAGAADTTALGLGYSHTLSPFTIYVILTVDDAPVIVFVDRLTEDRGLPPDLPPGLRRFRRTVGDLVLYEVTPRETAGVLGRFSVPAADSQPGT
ncbi:MAG: zf-HC2 domain-containing protein [Phycisphaerales bacterium]|nr:zf-HC2 domain-containing protein [Phycisphaerae bacterium]NNF41588.1 zf-HC2 domain-containing protein [Phycisphaerales bacterium]NNM26314.1 zf-HC2 domain-containing protein [Phycisphaerales bacterium]